MHDARSLNVTSNCRCIRVCVYVNLYQMRMSTHFIMTFHPLHKELSEHVNTHWTHARKDELDDVYLHDVHACAHIACKHPDIYVESTV